MSDEKINELDELIEIVEDENHIPDVPVSDEEFEHAQKILNKSDEVAQQAKEELEQLESPLIVHKITDASYQETASDVAMAETHAEDDGPTLVRHRFRKKQKKGNGAWKFVLVLLVICASVFAGLYYGGVIDFRKEVQTTKAESTTEPTTTLEEAYQGKIVLKGTYLFVDGVEVNGTEGLQNALKYEDPSPTAYEIVKEDANADYLNNEVIPLLMQMGFYDESTVISTIVSTGLMAEAEQTTQATTQATTQQLTTQNIQE